MAKRRGRILLRSTGNCMSITIVNSVWFFTFEYCVGDSGPCMVTCVCARCCGMVLPGEAPDCHRRWNQTTVAVARTGRLLPEPDDCCCCQNQMTVTRTRRLSLSLEPDDRCRCQNRTTVTRTRRLLLSPEPDDCRRC